MEPTELLSIGLNEREIKIYLFLLERGESIVTEIAKNTKANRSQLYSILENLAQRGFVSYIIKNNVRYYRAVEPTKILGILKEKEKSFENLIPQLLSLQKPASKKPRVEILEGKEGIKTLLNDLLRVKKEWLAFNIPGKGPDILGPMVHWFEKERQKQRIVLKAICVPTKEGLQRGKEFAAMKYTQVKYSHNYESPASNWIYGDRIAIIFWYKEFPFAIRITDQKLAESYKNYFGLIWKSLKS